MESPIPQPGKLYDFELLPEVIKTQYREFLRGKAMLVEELKNRYPNLEPADFLPELDNNEVAYFIENPDEQDKGLQENNLAAARAMSFMAWLEKNKS